MVRWPGGSGRITVHEDWENRGSFAAGSSTVQFRDGVAAVNDVLGGTSFHNLDIETAVGETYRFESGSEQRVAGALLVRGTGLPVRILSTVAGVLAQLNLLPGGTQAIMNVAVDGVRGSGQLLAPGAPNQSVGGNSPGWFTGGAAALAPQVIPLASPAGLAFLTVLMLLAGWVGLRGNPALRRRR